MYDIALFVKGERTLSELFDIFEKLDDMDVSIDYGNLQFQYDGLLLEATYPEEMGDIESRLNSIGVEIDWDTMTEWMCEQDSEEEEE